MVKCDSFVGKLAKEYKNTLEKNKYLITAITMILCLV